MIFALATPVAQSALGVFRISGKGCCEVFSKALNVPINENRKVFLRDVFWFGVLVDRCSVVFYGAPASYTGEDSVEVFCHGGLSVIKSFTNMFLEMGFKEAGPGEFSKIAFENGKMSLNEVEAVADLIHADDLQKTVLSSEAVAGKLSEIILGLGKEVDEVRVFIEGSIDFSDEDYNFLVEGGVEKRLVDVRDLLVGLIDASLISSRRVLKKRVLFFGPPNTGKSSLFNRLLGFERALVSSLPGTTRDLIDSEMFYNSVSLELVDSAGVRDTDDLIEAEGVALSGCEVGESDVVAVILDASTEVLASGFRELVKDSNYLMVFNKSDEGLPGGSYDSGKNFEHVTRCYHINFYCLYLPLGVRSYVPCTPQIPGYYLHRYYMTQIGWPSRRRADIHHPHCCYSNSDTWAPAGLSSRCSAGMPG